MNLKNYLDPNDSNYIPWYQDDADYNTNAKSFSDALARNKKFLKLFTDEINRLNKGLFEEFGEFKELTTEQIKQFNNRLDGIKEEMKDFFNQWLADGVLDEVINQDILNKKADRIEVNERGMNAKHPNDGLLPLKGDGTDDSERLIILGNYCFLNKISLFIPPGVYKINKKITTNFNIIGESMKHVELDFTENPDNKCIEASSFRHTIEKISIRANPNVLDQMPLDVFYSSDGSKFQNILIFENAPNGMRFSKLWYANVNNIRIKKVLPTGIGLTIEAHSEGGVNSVDFNSIYIHGGKHNVEFKGSSYVSEALQFTSSTFEESLNSAIKISSEQFRNIKFSSCYFENIYTDTTLSGVPVLLDSVNPKNIIEFDNCIVRSNNTKERVLVKGGASLKNFTNVNYMPVNNDNSAILMQNVTNIAGSGSNYFAGMIGSTQYDRISTQDMLRLYGKRTHLKTLPLNTVTPMFEVKTPTSNTVTVLKIRLIVMSNVNTYANSVSEYLVLITGKGSSQNTKVIRTNSIVSNTSLIEERLFLTGTTSKFNSITNTHDSIISLQATHEDFAGEVVIEVDGINTSQNENSQKKIAFY